MLTGKSVSLIIPCKNESDSLAEILEQVVNHESISEVIVVNDGSTDNSADIAMQLGAKVYNHQYSKGNGAAIKAGARIATGDILVFMDADGQHNPKEIDSLLEELARGYDMAIGARTHASQASKTRMFGNRVYNKLASYITGHKVHDLTSGFRAVYRDKFMEFIELLPNGFSYPTTITMAFYKTGYGVNFVPINVNQRKGESHLSVVKDGIRFLLIIFKVGVLYSPLKLFSPASALFFMLALTYYLYTFVTAGRFTNMSLLLFATSVFIFIFGLISEQITMLIYLSLNKKKK